MSVSCFMFFLCGLACARLVHLTDENFESIVNNSDGLPWFVEVYSPFCKHCEEFAPLWESVSGNRKWNGKLIFADLNCHLYGKLCRRFEGEGTPRLLWYDFGSQKGKQYFGERSEEGLESFIMKQLNPTLTTFESMEKVKEYGTAFVFTASGNDADAQELMDRVTRSRANLRIGFFSNITENDDHRNIVWYSRGKEVVYDGEWTDLSVGQFIDRHSLPFLSFYSQAVQYQFVSRRLPLTVFILPNMSDTEVERVIPYVEAIDGMTATALVDCKVNHYICRYTGTWAGPKGNVVHMGKGFEEFWSFDKEFDEEALKEWLDDIQNRRIPGRGPGKSAAVRALYDLRATGGFKYYVIYTPFVIAFSVVVLAGVLFFWPDTPVKKVE